jgi:hypothetical protein
MLEIAAADIATVADIPLFSTAADYHELNAGAHRKPPKVLSAPALVWHLAFWTNFQERGERREQPANPEWAPNKRPAEVNTALDRYIRELWTGLERTLGRPVDVTPCIGGVNLLFGGAYAQPQGQEVRRLTPRQYDIFSGTQRVVSLQFVWEQLDVTIRFETQTEYFTMSVFVELDRQRVKLGNKAAPSSIAALNKTMRRIVTYLNPRPAKTAAPASSSIGRVDKLVKGINRYSFHDFWRLFDTQVLSLGGRYRDAPIFQRVCADFRGFIASDQAVRFQDDRFFKFNGPPGWGAEAKQKLLPLIQHRIRVDHTRYECAVNYMLDGRALYLSTLGPQLPGIPEGERIPVEFIVYAHQRVDGRTVVNKWQLGRLVSQILQLGTFRLCALKDIRSLHDAGLELAELEEATQRARRAIAQTEAYATRMGQSVPATASDRNRVAMAEIASAHQKLNDITGAFLSKAGSGPLYRIERSRYYVRQFEDNVKLLRILRLEGDQPYDQFIRRRLGQEFDFIDRLGVRYERAMSSIVSLDQNYLSITQNSLVERATKIDEETKSIQSEIQDIQRWGELILLIFLVPYYFSHLLIQIKGEGWEASSWATIIVWGLLALTAVFRAYKQYIPRGFSTLALLFYLAIAVPPFVLLFKEVFTPVHKAEAQKPEQPPSQPLSLQGAGPATPVPATPEPSPSAPPKTAPDAPPQPQPSTGQR